jgi:hypothetical protein
LIIDIEFNESLDKCSLGAGLNKIFIMKGSISTYERRYVYDRCENMNEVASGYPYKLIT